MTLRFTGLAVAAILALGVGGCGGSDRPVPSPPPARPPAPGPIIGGGTARPADPLSAEDRSRATTVARRFLAGYLPYLYGRRRADQVGPVTAAVARTLRSSRARITPAQARRRPRLARLALVGQSARSALGTALVADGGPAAYRLTFTVERRGGRWLIADLGDDA